MGASSLAQYIDEQLKKGFTREQVTQYLERYGYNQQQISQAMQSLDIKPTLSGIFHKKKPADPRLVNYIRYYVSRGYDAASVGGFLRQYNYSQEDIDEALRAASVEERPVRHVVDISTKTFVILFLVLAAVATGGFAVFHLMNPSGPAKLLDYEVSLGSNQVLPGDTLSFKNSFLNIGSQRKYDMQVSYRIVDPATGQVLNSKQETIGISTVISKEQEIFIPADAEPGMYRLDCVVHYGKETANASVNFWISKPAAAETCSDGIRNQDEEGIDCGGICKPCTVTPAPTCSDGIKNQNEAGIDCGGVCKPCTVTPAPTCSDGIKNQNEEGIDCGGVCKPCTGSIVRPDNKAILAKVSAMGKSDESESLRLCSSIDDDRMADECFLTISQSYGNSDYCSRIKIESSLNICYMHFINNGDYSVCDKIPDVYIKRSCEQLKNIRDIEESQNISSTFPVS